MARKVSIIVDLDDLASGQIKRLYGQIRSESKKTSRDTKKDVGVMAKSFGSLPATLARIRVGLGLLTFAGVGVIGKFVKLASEAEEVQSKFDTVFKELKQTANLGFESLADSIGRNSTELKTFGGNLGDILKPLGFSSQQAFKLSRDMTKLALDVASFNNAQDKDVIRAFASALTGERESLKTYGIVISEADVKTEAYRAGLAKVGSELGKTAKAQATVNLLYRNSTDAQGDLERTSDSFANTLKTFGANVRTLGENLGEILLPAANEVLKFLNEGLKQPIKIRIGPEISTEELTKFVQSTGDMAKASNETKTAISQFLTDLKAGSVTTEGLIQFTSAVADASGTIASNASKTNTELEKEQEITKDIVLSDDELLNLQLQRRTALKKMVGLKSGILAADIQTRIEEEGIAKAQSIQLLATRQTSDQLNAIFVMKRMIRQLDEQNTENLPEALEAEREKAAIMATQLLAANGLANQFEIINGKLVFRGKLEKASNKDLNEYGKTVNNLNVKVGEQINEWQNVESTISGGLSNVITNMFTKTRDMNNLLKQFRDDFLRAMLRLGFKAVFGFDKGGIIPGFPDGGIIRDGIPGQFGRDNRLITAQAGESILTRETTSRLGGERGIAALNKGASPGMSIGDINLTIMRAPGEDFSDMNLITRKLVPALADAVEKRLADLPSTRIHVRQAS